MGGGWRDGGRDHIYIYIYMYCFGVHLGVLVGIRMEFQSPLGYHPPINGSIPGGSRGHFPTKN